MTTPITAYPQRDSAPDLSELITKTAVGLKENLDVHVNNPTSSPVNTTTVGGVVAAGTPTIRNISVGTTEVSFTFTANTRRFSIKLRGAAKLFIGTTAGSTTAGPFFTLESNSSYTEDELDVTSITLYIKSNLAGQTLELWEWQ